MMPLSGVGKLLIVLGGLLIIIGAAIVFPLTTSILISVILSLVLYLFSRR